MNSTNRIQTKALIEGAIFAAITVLIGIIRFYIPIAGVISIVWLVPTILIAFRHGFKVSIISVVASSALVTVMTQPIEGLGFLIAFGLPGIAMGYMLKKKLSAGTAVLFTGIILAVCSVASIYLGMLVTRVDIVKTYNQMFEDMKNAYGEIADSMANTYSAAGISREDILKGKAAFENNIEMMKLLLPGGFLISGILMAFINFKLTRRVLKRINYFIEDVKPFSLWTLSNKWTIFFFCILVYIAAEILLIKLPQLYSVTMNIFTVIIAVFAILGLSVTKFFLDRYSAPKALKVIIIFLLLFVFGNITMLIGVFDMLFDYRKLRNKPVGDV